MFKPTIGIEVHVELKSKTKVYSDSLNIFDQSINTYVNEIDMGYPGVLPKLNKEVINMALKACHALNLKVNTVMHFDRKNYFYPDLPKGYQITQSKTPIGYDGYVEIEVDGYTKKIGIERMHIEEDTCKSIHDNKGTLLNFNRSGVPLLEIVSKPEISNEKEAVAYLEALREILLYLGISDVKIEEGSMRCDANISVSKTSELGTKIEVKNIGSISNVASSIKYEIVRQTEKLLNNEILKEETRRFDDKTNTTILMRVKETGNDYRYFPEPDIPFVHISNDWINSIVIPKLPNELRHKYRFLEVNENNIKTILSNYELCMFFESINDKTNPILASNLLTGDIISYLNKKNISINETKLTTDNFISLINKIEQKEISSKQSKDLIPIMLEKEDDLESIIASLGIKQISDTTFLVDIVKEVLDNNISSINDYKEGKDRAVKYLMGQIMSKTKGQANPQLVSTILIDMLNKE
jgi:aspartyl-tRNA(Asn)/glutamyl-tRNA(Gln) amidotransferase subunit B